MWSALLPLLGGCSSETPGGDTAPAFSVTLEPVPAYNQEPFAGLDTLAFVVDPDGVAQRYEVDVPASGALAESPQLPALDEAVVAVEGLSGGDVVAWGRSGPLSASRDLGDAEAQVFFGLTDQPAWLDALSPGLYRPIVAALGDGAFLVAGGVGERSSGGATELTAGQDAAGVLHLVPPSPSLAVEGEGTLPAFDGQQDGVAHTERFGATVTPLTGGDDRGKLLVAGGATAPGWLAPETITADVTLYDPSSGTWGPLGAGAGLQHARAEHLAVAVEGGGVVVGGGWRNDGDGLSTAGSIEIFDPAAGRFGEALDAPALGTVDVVGATLPGRGALLCGGAVVTLTDDGQGLDTFTGSRSCVLVGEDLAPATDDVPSLPANLVGSAMIALPDGRTLLVGGAIVDDPLAPDASVTATSKAWILAENGVTWSNLPLLAAPRAGHTLALLPDGRVLVAGGAATWSLTAVPDDTHACVEVFDPRASTFEPVGECSGSAGALAAPAWKPSVAVDPEFGALFVGGAMVGRDGPVASTQVTLFLPPR